MGTKGHGTYVRVYGDVWTHRKTLRLAAALVALKWPRRAARSEAVAQLVKLAHWCMSNTDDGRIDHLPADLFAVAVGWDEPKSADALLAAWLDSGFLDVGADGSVRLHEFEVYAEDLLDARAEAARKRAKYREARARDRGSETSADSPRRNAGDLRGETPETSAEYPRATHARATRASGNGNGNGNGNGSALPTLSEEPDVPEAIADHWARECGHLPQPVRPLPPKLRDAAKEAERQSPGRDWGATFARVARSDFLSGRVKDWRANLGWALTAENLAKLDAGNYDQGQRGSKRANDLAASAAAASQILDAAYGDAP